MSGGGPDFPEEISASDRLRAMPEIGGLAVRPEGRNARSFRRPAPRPPPPDPAAPPDPEGRGRNLDVRL